MAAYHWVYDSPHLQADCQAMGSAPEPYAWQSSMGYVYLLHHSSNSSSSDMERNWWRRGVVASSVRRMNKVNPRLARLVLGWVTILRRVYHLGM